MIYLFLKTLSLYISVLLRPRRLFEPLFPMLFKHPLVKGTTEGGVDGSIRI
jgi:hypothetical protein